jgi:hypothetical protein
VRGIKKDILTFDTPQLAAGRFIRMVFVNMVGEK